MSRSRKDRGLNSAASEEQQLWQSVRAHLKTLEKLQALSSDDTSLLETKRTRYVENGLPESEKDDLESAYKQVDVRFNEEAQEVDRAMEKLELLLAVRDDTNLDSSVRRKKRKLEGDQLSPPGAFSSHYRQTSPTSATEAQSESLPFSGEGRKRSYTKSSSSTSASTNRRPTLSSAKDVDTGTSGAISASTKEYVDPARVRREVLAHQLPLQKGRKVAFRQPNKNKVGPGAANVSGGSSTRGDVSGGANGTGEEDGETWIMATVIECINNDRNRYVVQDDEDAAMPTYNTTLKAVVPLPENLHTLPLEDYKVGTQVLGLYPDTSCFYRATVQGGGPGLNGKVTSKMQRRAEEVLNTPYALEFEDDEGAIRMVPANLVVERP